MGPRVLINGIWYKPSADGESCTIIMLDDKGLLNWTWLYGEPDDLYRHEVGHCNGWQNNHPGMRGEE